MPRGDKSSYTDKQERKADHIADAYKDRGVSAKEAERRASEGSAILLNESSHSPSFVILGLTRG